MGSYRIGGLAVALGIGSAVVAGHGVASADTSGETGSESPSSSSSSTQSTGSTGSSSGKPSSAPAPPQGDDADASGKTETDPTEAETTETTDDLSVDEAKTDDDTPAPKKRSNKLRPSSETADPVASRAVADTTTRRSAAVVVRAKPVPQVATTDDPQAVTAVSQAAVADAPAVTIATVSAPVEPSESAIREPQNPVEVATVALSRAVSTLLDPLAGDAPTAPLAAPAMWTMAAAARRELSPTTSVDQTAGPVANSLTLSVAQEPKVVAIEQTAPLEFLQHVPVLGPLVFTPIVVAIHLIPVVGDVLHQFVGYPVQWGLPADAPKPRDVMVISDDGTPIYVHFIPARGLEAEKKAPTVLNGPGLGLPGATTLYGTIFDPFATDLFGMLSVGTLRDAGYNVVTWDPRGEWKSGGQLELNSADFEGRDMSAIISWIADQPEVRLDNPGDPRIGMVGVSYGGGIQLVTAANDKRVDAIVPAITYHGLDTALYKNQAFKNSWATPLTAVLGLTLARINPRILPAAVYGALTGEMTQADEDLLIARNPDVDKITVPTLLIQGTVDTIFSLQEADETAQILIANGVPTKVVWFCGGHGICAHNLIDLSDGALIEKRTLEWLNRYVKGDPSGQTGPQFEWVDQRGQWHSSNTYPISPGTSIVASSTDKTLPLIPYIGGSGIPFVPLAFNAPHAVNLRVPATTETFLVGAPQLTLTYSGTGSSGHVSAQLVDDNTGLVLGYIATPVPVTLDGATHTITVDLEPVAHTLRPGESVTLQLVASAGLYEKINPALGVLNVSSMQLTLPTANPAAVQTI